MIEKMKLYMGVGPSENYESLTKRARLINMAIMLVIVWVMLFVSSIWMRIPLFMAAFAVSVVVSLASREAERKQRPQ